jgi:hypothetical protein
LKCSQKNTKFFIKSQVESMQDYIDGRLHLDHIIPLDAFNFTKPTDIDFQRCWALSNLQLLPADENIQKSNKISKPFQPNLAI